MPLPKPLKENSDYKWRRKSGWDYDSWSSQRYLNIDENENYIITTNTNMIETVCELEDEDLCEVVWLSTWTQHTGIPKVLITHEDIVNAAIHRTDGAAGLQKRYEFLTRLVGRKWRAAGGTGPQTPRYIGSVLSEAWWKWDAVRALRRRDHDVAFVDDMLSTYRRLHKNEEKADDGLKLVRVEGTRGFVRADYEDTRAWLLSRQEEQPRR